MTARERYMQNSFMRITTEGTTVVQSAGHAGVLDGVVPGIAGAASSTIIAQNSAGTVFLKLDATDVHPRTGLNLRFPDGLSMVTSGTTAPDYTVLFR